MARNKSADMKKMLGARAKSNKRVPVHIMVKTKRKVRSNPKQYNWRGGKGVGHVARKKMKASAR